MNGISDPLEMSKTIICAKLSYVHKSLFIYQLGILTYIVKEEVEALHTLTLIKELC